jgi:signal transduction histidine kinase
MVSRSSRILVVDDEPDIEVIIRHKFRQQIREGAWEFLFASNGREALEVVRETADLDLLVTDINMPVMDGLTLLRELNTAGIDLKSIVISAYDDMNNIRQAMNQGAFDFVTKPIDMTDLESTIRKNLAVVSQLKEARQLQMQRVEIEAASRAKSKFVADLSHELRTPLNAIVLYSELVLEVAEETGAVELLDDIRKIVQTGKHLVTLVDGILDFSKIEAGKLELHLERFEVTEMVKGVVDGLRPVFDKNRASLTVKMAGDAGVMFSDQTRVRQTLYNLLSNASKFAREGAVELDVSREGETMVFVVADNGIGMSEEERGRLFQPFTQADASVQRRFGGTGLGLAITERFCQAMKGSIEVASEPGKGARFTVRLPAYGE